MTPWLTPPRRPSRLPFGPLAVLPFLAFWPFALYAQEPGLVQEHKAEAFFTPVHLNRGERLRFTLVNGQVRELLLLDCGIATRGEKKDLQWTLWADIQVDGHPFHLVYSPFEMNALYRPKAINGMRIALDGVKDLSAVVGWAEKRTGQHPAAAPPPRTSGSG